MPANYQITDLQSWVSLQESTAANRIDRVNGVLKDVKICGWESPNCPHVPDSPTQPTKGTKYTRDAFQKALSLYEGAEVCLNHEDKNTPPGQRRERDLRESIGVLKNVRLAADGLRGDFHYDPHNSFAPSLLHDAEKLNRYGLSHVVSGSGPVRDGYLIVESIPIVKGVDLVRKPATVANLWESQQMADTSKITFVELVEWVASKAPRIAKGVKGLRRSTLIQFAESDMMTKKCGPDGLPLKEADPMADAAPPPMGELPVDAPTEGADPAEALWQGFRAAMLAIIDDSAMDPATKAAKLKEYLDSHDKLKAGESPDAVAAESEEPDAKDKKKPEDKAGAAATESLSDLDKAELAMLRAGKAVASLCESLNFKPTDKQSRALAQINESDRREFILDTIKQMRSPQSLPTRGGGPPDGKTPQSDAVKYPTTPEERRRFLRTA